MWQPELDCMKRTVVMEEKYSKYNEQLKEQKSLIKATLCQLEILLETRMTRQIIKYFEQWMYD